MHKNIVILFKSCAFAFFLIRNYFKENYPND